MADDSPSNLHLLAANLALTAGGIHLLLGAANWIRYASVGLFFPPDLRWPLFVVSGVAVFAGLALAWRGYPRRPLYAGGIVLMVGYVVGYFGWHLSGHRPLFFLGPATSHGGSTVSFLLAHLFAGPVETLSIGVEVALAVLLGYLLVTES